MKIQPALPENPYLISVLKSKSPEQFPQVLLSGSMFRRKSLKTFSQTYPPNGTSPNNVFYAASGNIVLLTCFPLDFLVFSCISCGISTRVLLCARMCEGVGSCIWPLSVDVDTAVHTLTKHVLTTWNTLYWKAIEDNPAQHSSKCHDIRCLEGYRNILRGKHSR